MGIKLGSLPQLQVIAAFQQPSPPLQVSKSDSANTAPTDKDAAILIDIDEELPELDKELDCTLDLGDRASDPEVTPSTAPLLNEPPVPLTPDELPSVKSAQMSSEDTTSVIQPIARKHKRPPLLAEDLERMTMLMAQQGVFGSPADLFHSFLDAFEQLQHQHQAQPQQGLEVIRWFTTEIDSLRATISQLEQERDSLQASTLPTDQLESLKTENAQLTGV